MIFQPSNKKEVASNPKARAALRAEWNKLRKQRVWLAEPSKKRAKSKSARCETALPYTLEEFSVFAGVKHIELDPEFLNYKGRVVSQGNQVRDETGLAAVFSEQQSGASHLESSRLLDMIARSPGCAGQQSDAVSAYTQAKCGHLDLSSS